MTKNEQHIDDALLLDYIRERVSDEQKQQVDRWLNEKEPNRLYLEKIKELWNRSAAYSSFEKTDTDGDWVKVAERIGLEGHQVKMERARKFQFGSLLRIAAILIIVLSIGYMMWNLIGHQGLPVRQVAITSGEVIKTIDLPDGSLVYMNSHSELTYPRKFRKNRRQVRLSGEAFFEVMPDKRKPFSIISGDATIKVLGTSFNVLSDEESNEVTVSVTEGKVALYPNRREKRAIHLISGEQGIYRDNEVIKRDTIKRNFLSWKTRKLEFEQTPLPEVIHSLEKYYKTIIHLQEPLTGNPMLTSVFEDQPLEEVLEELNLLLGLEYRQKNDTIFVQIE